LAGWKARPGPLLLDTPKPIFDTVKIRTSVRMSVRRLPSSSVRRLPFVSRRHSLAGDNQLSKNA
jgi:hypothetical protein